jgi:hypothetical protein
LIELGVVVVDGHVTFDEKVVQLGLNVDGTLDLDLNWISYGFEC